MMHKDSSEKVPVSVVGASGYAGQELVQLLLEHPHATLKHCFSSRPEKENGVPMISIDKLFDQLTPIVFLATPPQVSFNLVPQLLNAGVKVIDLSGAFRLSSAEAQLHYHCSPQIKGHYGLIPFAKKSENNLISNPGCFATAALMALLPLLKNHIIDSENIVLDAKSGTTGAGKSLKEELLFSEVSGDFSPYRVGEHQHLPEICQAAVQFTETQIHPHLVTHLLPIDRGLSVGIYATLTQPFSRVKEAFESAYQQYPLVRHGENIESLSRIKNVVRTARAHISYKAINNKLYVFSVIDNLLKGAASQAIENFNQLIGLPLDQVQ